MSKAKIGILGLGYVGLPLAIAFDKAGYEVIGYDIDDTRIKQLHYDRVDHTGEVSDNELMGCEIKFTCFGGDMDACDYFIITVPTPIDAAKKPDLEPLKKASQIVGPLLKRGSIVIYESTVYPGATEEVCVPIIEKASGWKLNEDFYVGYSPERINPADPERGVADIVKVVSGSTEETRLLIGSLYGDIITAGIAHASTIKTAEAAKVIENTQRDVNIALINELAMLFNRLGIDTHEVLKVAGTKWNFLPFRPGLVGGHCIGVDPYYLTHKAQEVGHQPDVILAGRRVNDGMGTYIAQQVIKKMAGNMMRIAGSRVLVLGYTFKENCPDTRNTRVVDIVEELNDHNISCDVYDKIMADNEVLPSYVTRVQRFTEHHAGMYDAIIIAVAHDWFKKLGIDSIRQIAKRDALVFDVKGMFPADQTDWRL